MDVAFWGASCRVCHRIRHIAWYGCSAIGRYLSGAPSDSVEVENGCMVCAKQAFRVPSDSAQTEDGCMICAREAFRVPSDSAHTEDGCMIPIQSCFLIWKRHKKKASISKDESLKLSRARRIRTFKMTESESAALPFGYSPMNLCKRHICRLRIMIIEDDSRFCKSFF